MVQVLPTEAGTLGWAVRRQLPPTLGGSNKTEVTKQYWNLFIPEARNTPALSTHKQPLMMMMKSSIYIAISGPNETCCGVRDFTYDSQHLIGLGRVGKAWRLRHG